MCCFVSSVAEVDTSEFFYLAPTKFFLFLLPPYVVFSVVLSLLLHCALSWAVYCNRPCLCVCLFVGLPYYSQRAVFALPLSTSYLRDAIA